MCSADDFLSIVKISLKYWCLSISEVLFKTCVAMKFMDDDDDDDDYDDDDDDGLVVYTYIFARSPY